MSAISTLVKSIETDLFSLAAETRSSLPAVKEAAERAMFELRDVHRSSSDNSLSQAQIDDIKRQCCHPFLIACNHTHAPKKVLLIAFAAIHKLIRTNDGVCTSDMRGIARVLELQSESSDEEIKLRVLQTLPLLLNHPGYRPEHEVLAQTMSLCFNFLKEKSPGLRFPAVATLQQLTSILFDRAESELRLKVDDVAGKPITFSPGSTSPPINSPPKLENYTNESPLLQSCHLFLQDMVLISGGLPTQWMRRGTPVPRVVAADLIDECIRLHPFLFTSCKGFQELLTRLVVPLLLRQLAVQKSFPLCLRFFRITRSIMLHLHAALPAYCRALMALLVRMLHAAASGEDLGQAADSNINRFGSNAAKILRTAQLAVSSSPSIPSAAAVPSAPASAAVSSSSNPADDLETALASAVSLRISPPPQYKLAMILELLLSLVSSEELLLSFFSHYDLVDNIEEINEAYARTSGRSLQADDLSVSRSSSHGHGSTLGGTLSRSSVNSSNIAVGSPQPESKPELEPKNVFKRGRKPLELVLDALSALAAHICRESETVTMRFAESIAIYDPHTTLERSHSFSTGTSLSQTSGSGGGMIQSTSSPNSAVAASLANIGSNSGSSSTSSGGGGSGSASGPSHIAQSQDINVDYQLEGGGPESAQLGGLKPMQLEMAIAALPKRFLADLSVPGMDGHVFSSSVGGLGAAIEFSNSSSASVSNTGGFMGLMRGSSTGSTPNANAGGSGMVNYAMDTAVTLFSSVSSVSSGLLRAATGVGSGSNSTAGSDESDVVTPPARSVTAATLLALLQQISLHVTQGIAAGCVELLSKDNQEAPASLTSSLVSPHTAALPRSTEEALRSRCFVSGNIRRLRSSQLRLLLLSCTRSLLSIFAYILRLSSTVPCASAPLAATQALALSCGLLRLPQLLSFCVAFVAAHAAPSGSYSPAACVQRLLRSLHPLGLPAAAAFHPAFPEASVAILGEQARGVDARAVLAVRVLLNVVHSLGGVLGPLWVVFFDALAQFQAGMDAASHGHATAATSSSSTGAIRSSIQRREFSPIATEHISKASADLLMEWRSEGPPAALDMRPRLRALLLPSLLPPSVPESTVRQVYALTNPLLSFFFPTQDDSSVYSRSSSRVAAVDEKAVYDVFCLERPLLGLSSSSFKIDVFSERATHIPASLVDTIDPFLSSQAGRAESDRMLGAAGGPSGTSVQGHSAAETYLHLLSIAKDSNLLLADSGLMEVLSSDNGMFVATSLANVGRCSLLLPPDGLRAIVQALVELTLNMSVIVPAASTTTPSQHSPPAKHTTKEKEKEKDKKEKARVGLLTGKGDVFSSEVQAAADAREIVALSARTQSSTAAATPTPNIAGQHPAETQLTVSLGGNGPILLLGHILAASLPRLSEILHLLVPLFDFIASGTVSGAAAAAGSGPVSAIRVKMVQMLSSVSIAYMRMRASSNGAAAFTLARSLLKSNAIASSPSAQTSDSSSQRAALLSPLSSRLLSTIDKDSHTKNSTTAASDDSGIVLSVSQLLAPLRQLLHCSYAPVKAEAMEWFCALLEECGRSFNDWDAQERGGPWGTVCLCLYELGLMVVGGTQYVPFGTEGPGEDAAREAPSESEIGLKPLDFNEEPPLRVTVELDASVGLYKALQKALSTKSGVFSIAKALELISPYLDLLGVFPTPPLPPMQPSLVPTAFRCVQLVLDEFCSDIVQDSAAFSALARSLELFSLQTRDLNARLTAVGGMWRMMDVLQAYYSGKLFRSAGAEGSEGVLHLEGSELDRIISSYRAVFFQLFNMLLRLSESSQSYWIPFLRFSPGSSGGVNSQSVDVAIVPFFAPWTLQPPSPEAAEVRNSAIHSLLSALSSHAPLHTSRSFHRIFLKLMDLLYTITSNAHLHTLTDVGLEGSNLGSRRGVGAGAPGAEVKVTLHHSKNTLAKQWGESRVVAYRGTVQFVRGIWGVLLRQRWFPDLCCSLVALLERSIIGGVTPAFVGTSVTNSADSSTTPLSAPLNEELLVEPTTVAVACLQSLQTLGLLFVVPAGPAVSGSASGTRVVDGTLVSRAEEAEEASGPAVERTLSFLPSSTDTDSIDDESDRDSDSESNSDSNSTPSFEPLNVEEELFNTRRQLWTVVMSALENIPSSQIVSLDQEEVVLAAYVDVLSALACAKSASAVPDTPSSTVYSSDRFKTLLSLALATTETRRRLRWGLLNVSESSENLEQARRSLLREQLQSPRLEALSASERALLRMLEAVAKALKVPSATITASSSAHASGATPDISTSFGKQRDALTNAWGIFLNVLRRLSLEDETQISLLPLLGTHAGTVAVPPSALAMASLRLLQQLSAGSASEEVKSDSLNTGKEAMLQSLRDGFGRTVGLCARALLQARASYNYARAELAAYQQWQAVSTSKSNISVSTAASTTISTAVVPLMEGISLSGELGLEEALLAVLGPAGFEHTFGSSVGAGARSSSRSERIFPLKIWSFGLGGAFSNSSGGSGSGSSSEASEAGSIHSAGPPVVVSDLGRAERALQRLRSYADELLHLLVETVRERLSPSSVSSDSEDSSRETAGDSNNSSGLFSVLGSMHKLPSSLETAEDLLTTVESLLGLKVYNSSLGFDGDSGGDLGSIPRSTLFGCSSSTDPIAIMDRLLEVLRHHDSVLPIDMTDSLDDQSELAHLVAGTCACAPGALPGSRLHTALALQFTYAAQTGDNNMWHAVGLAFQALAGADSSGTGNGSRTSLHSFIGPSSLLTPEQAPQVLQSGTYRAALDHLGWTVTNSVVADTSPTNTSTTTATATSSSNKKEQLDYLHCAEFGSYVVSTFGGSEENSSKSSAPEGSTVRVSPVQPLSAELFLLISSVRAVHQLLGDSKASREGRFGLLLARLVLLLRAGAAFLHFPLVARHAVASTAFPSMSDVDLLRRSASLSAADKAEWTRRRAFGRACSALLCSLAFLKLPWLLPPPSSASTTAGSNKMSLFGLSTPGLFLGEVSHAGVERLAHSLGADDGNSNNSKHLLARLQHGCRRALLSAHVLSLEAVALTDAALLRANAAAVLARASSAAASATAALAALAPISSNSSGGGALRFCGAESVTVDATASCLTVGALLAEMVVSPAAGARWAALAPAVHDARGSGLKEVQFYSGILDFEAPVNTIRENLSILHAVFTRLAGSADPIIRWQAQELLRLIACVVFN